MMLSFLLQISQFEEQNKMTVGNLAVVFAPCFLRPVELTMSELQNMGVSIKFLNVVLANYEKMFPNISYKLFLTGQDQSQSTSTNSSTGVGEQLKQIEEEKIQHQQQIEQIEDSQNMRDLLQKRTQTEIPFQSQLKHQKPQFSDDEDIEYNIDDILGHVKEDLPINPTKTKKD